MTKSRGRSRLVGVAVAGVAGGLAFMLFAMVVRLGVGRDFWGPPKLVAAILLGPSVLPPPAGPEPATFAVGIAFHLLLSVGYAAVLAVVIDRLRPDAAIWVGFAYGLLLYFVNFYVFTGAFPWFDPARNWITVYAHLIYGGVAASVYKRYVRRPVLRWRPLPGQPEPRTA